MSIQLKNPLIGGFNPDPSILRDGDGYYLVTSTFSYLPGIPIYHSTDLENWELVGHVVTRTNQLKIDGVPTLGGVWAPTIRKHDGVYYVVVTDAMGRGTLIFTASNPRGPWSDGIVAEVEGIDPDLAWDSDGVCYMTYSGLIITEGKHLGIQQVRIDTTTGKRLSEPKSLWSGTGLMFPEAPHLYEIDGKWYLLIAEGGTERGHSVSIARSDSPEGPFIGAPNNPILSARSTSREIQNTGHADLFQAHDGNWYMVLLGMHVHGLTRSFSPLGRESFITSVQWNDGWPTTDPVFPQGDANKKVYKKDFRNDEITGEMLGIRSFPASIAEKTPAGLKLTGNGTLMNGEKPQFIGKRQEILFGKIEAEITATGTAGLTLYYDEISHYDVEINGQEIIARSMLPMLVHEEKVALPNNSDNITLFMRFDAPPEGYESKITSDFISLGFRESNGAETVIAQYDGRFLSAEVTCSFTGRVFGTYVIDGTLLVHSLSETPAL